jgi:hypothetical protein
MLPRGVRPTKRNTRRFRGYFLVLPIESRSALEEVTVKLLVFLLCLTAASAAAYALDLPSLARREKARRSAVAGRPARTFADRDLEQYGREWPKDSDPAPPRREAPPPAERPRDLTRERAYWRKEALQHQREVAKIEASVRRLQWRLNEKRSRPRSRTWVTEDPTIALLEDSIRALTEERKRLEERFRERARKEGALPGWLR